MNKYYDNYISIIFIIKWICLIEISALFFLQCHALVLLFKYEHFTPFLLYSVLLFWVFACPVFGRLGMVVYDLLKGSQFHLLVLSHYFSFWLINRHTLIYIYMSIERILERDSYKYNPASYHILVSMCINR